MLYPSKPLTTSLSKIPKYEEVIEVLRVFRSMNPWRGTNKQRYDKFLWLCGRLNEIYGLNVKLVSRVHGPPYTFSGASYYNPVRKTIVLIGRYSVITFLHEYGHALDYSNWSSRLPAHGEHWAVMFSVTLFKTVFPDKYAKLTSVGHCLVKSS